jgi:replicative DNA helicase
MSAVKIPPQNVEAEQSVIGALLIDKEAITKVADLLASKDFYQPAHEKIYAVILDLYEKSKPIDILTVESKLKESEQLKEVGGSGYLAELANRVPSSSHVEEYAKIVKEKKILRDLIRASAEITEGVFESGREIDELLDEVEQKIFRVSQTSVQKAFIHLKDELRVAYERIEKLHRGESVLRGVTSGFQELDHLLSGFQRSDLIIIGARPSLGKTSLALDIARNAALRGSAAVGIFSLEMSREQVVDRLISADSQVPLWKIRTGRITDDSEFEAIQHSLGRLSAPNIFIDDTPSPNIMQMRSMARRLQSDRKLDLLIVDYLQLITPRTKSDNMVHQVTEISRGLKSLARELNIPIIALSQLSRGIEQRDHRIPRLSDLRESGSIEQDADVVIFIYRKDKDKELEEVPTEEQNVAQIIIAKHRNGPLGTIQLKFDQEHTSFRPIEKRFGEPDL